MDDETAFIIGIFILLFGMIIWGANVANNLELSVSGNEVPTDNPMMAYGMYFSVLGMILTLSAMYKNNSGED